MTSYTVENIQEIEPVYRKETEVIPEEPEEEEIPPPLFTREDPSQMKLEL